jgi:hypothetical protein
VQLSRIRIMQNRVERAQALHDTRDWVQERRARTRQLIELGGLVQKAGLVELLHDDRAALLGAMMELADQLRGGQEEGTGADARTPAQLTAAWRHRGLRAFEADKEASTA